MKVVLLLLTVAAAATAQVREFRIDAGHSDVAFAIGFLGHPVRGRFDDIRGTISYAASNATTSSITLVIGAKSIATGSTHRDEHLRSSDFFDVARYPTIVFRSTSVTRRANKYLLAGTLTMHGVTRAIEIPFVETTKPVDDPHGSTLLYFSGAFRLARKDFGIVGGSAHNDWFDAVRSATMADSVDIALEVAGWDTDFTRVRQYDAALDRIATAGIGASVARVQRLNGLPADSVRGVDYDIDQLARALVFRGRTADAVVLLRAAADALPLSVATNAALARTYELAGDRSAARAAVERALKLDSLDPRSLEIKRRLGAP